MAESDNASDFSLVLENEALFVFFEEILEFQEIPGDFAFLMKFQDFPGDFLKNREIFTKTGSPGDWSKTGRSPG